MPKEPGKAQYLSYRQRSKLRQCKCKTKTLKTFEHLEYCLQVDLLKRGLDKCTKTLRIMTFSIDCRYVECHFAESRGAFEPL